MILPVHHFVIRRKLDGEVPEDTPLDFHLPVELGNRSCFSLNVEDNVLTLSFSLDGIRKAHFAPLIFLPHFHPALGEECFDIAECFLLFLIREICRNEHGNFVDARFLGGGVQYGWHGICG